MSQPGPILKIVKRDGNVVAYDRERISTAIFKAAASIGGKDRALAEQRAADVERFVHGGVHLGVGVHLSPRQVAQPVPQAARCQEE